MALFLSAWLAFFMVKNESKIQWVTPKNHDFGAVLRGREAEFTFVFKNTTEKALVVDNVRTDCGCTASSWDETPVLAQQLGKIKVSYDTDKTGYFNKKVTVWIRGQRKPEKLTIEGEVIEQ